MSRTYKDCPLNVRVDKTSKKVFGKGIQDVLPKSSFWTKRENAKSCVVTFDVSGYYSSYVSENGSHEDNTDTKIVDCSEPSISEDTLNNFKSHEEEVIIDFFNYYIDKNFFNGEKYDNEPYMLFGHFPCTGIIFGGVEDDEINSIFIHKPEIFVLENETKTPGRAPSSPFFFLEDKAFISHHHFKMRYVFNVDGRTESYTNEPISYDVSNLFGTSISHRENISYFGFPKNSSIDKKRSKRTMRRKEKMEMKKKFSERDYDSIGGVNETMMVSERHDNCYEW